MKRSLRCQIPEKTSEKLLSAGSSYGQLICDCGKNCLIVDVFTGAKVLSPQLPITNECYLFCCMLTAPLASPKSHLLVCARQEGEYFLLDWLIGSDSWSKLQLGLNDSVMIRQIVEFNGQFIAMDIYRRFYTLSLAPQLGLQELATVRLDNMFGCPHAQPWFVVCSGMLLIVDHHYSRTSSGAPINYNAYRLDMSTEPATWVEVGKLENDALFMGYDIRSPAFSCLSPGQWGGRSNCLYYAHYKQPWILHGLGDDADAIWNDSTHPAYSYTRCVDDQIRPFWVYPSMFYLDGQ